jgi:uncharacterized protein YndB with AHSA1/START domain
VTNSLGSREHNVGSIRRLADGKGAARMEDIYDTDAEDLWTALTDPIRLARWVAVVEGDLRLGGRFRSRFTSGYVGPGRVDLCDAPRRLRVTMDPDSPEETVIEAWLTAIGNQTHLVVEERGLPIDELAAHGAGWQVHVEDLAAHVAGHQPGEWHERWVELRPTYEEMAERWP